jgi:hypothetical protein
MSEWTIEGDETMRWDVLASAPKEQSDECDRCGEDRVLFHNEATGLSLCEQCDLITDEVEELLDGDRHKCDGCNGSGTYYGAGRVENGKFIGFSGTCFRCQGKGHQTESDVKRNRYYDDRVRRFSV